MKALLSTTAKLPMAPIDIRHGVDLMKLALTLLLVLGRSHDAAWAERPNIVFILADDLGWADTTFYGHTNFYQTPHLERLAKRGMTFTRAYSASPLCSPTRASVLSGQNPARIGITAPVCHTPEVRMTASVRAKAPATAKSLICDSVTRFDTRYVTLAERLQAAGYATGHFGKWHLGPEPYSALQQGFEVDVPHHPGPGPAGSYVAPWKFKDFDHDPAVPDQHIEDRMAQEAVRFLEEHRSEPFFLNYWMFSVHAPFDAKNSLIEKHRTRVTPDDPQRSPTYAAMVESMDDSVGTLLNTLDRLGIADRTAVVFYSDNGGNMYNQIDGTTPTSNAPLRGGKATLWEGGIRVPAVVSWPGVTQAGSRSDALIQSTDFYPTILRLLGLPLTPDHPVDGVDITPALRGESFERGPMFTFFPHQTQVPDHLPPAVSVHRGDWKLIRMFHEGEDGSHAWHLYNLRTDLGETEDLAAEQPDLTRELDTLIDAFLKQTGAVVPGRNPAYEMTLTPMTQPSAWQTSRDAQVSERDGLLVVRSTGNDPWLSTRDLPASGQGPFVVRIRLKSSASGPGMVYFTVKPRGGFNKDQSVPFPLQHDGNFQTYEVKLPCNTLRGLRLDPGNAAGEISIERIELLDAAGRPLKRWPTGTP